MADRRSLILGIGWFTLCFGVGCSARLASLGGEDKVEPAKPVLGMNLASVIDYSREWDLVDTFKASRPWIVGDKENIAYNAEGYPLLKPGQAVSTLLVREINGHYPGGKYVATYEGTGKVEIKRWDVTRVLVDKPGRIEVEVTPGDGGIQVDITESDPKDPIRNLHVWMPGFEKAKSPFHPEFMKRLEPFPVLRFMDWQRTNGNPLKSWKDRPKMTDARYSTDSGVPVELMIQLANERGADPWFCMPHLADNDYVEQFATLVKKQLDPKRKVYIEYSNEVWNSQFPQAQYAANQGKEYKLSNDAYQAQLFYFSMRSVEIFKIWEKVFGGKDRLVRVMSAQAANSWTSEQVLTFGDAYKHTDALAIAPYFGNEFGDPNKAEQTAQMSLDKLFAGLKAEVEGKNHKMIQEQAKLARRFKVQLIAYEGGQHLVGHGGAENNAKLTDLFIAANRDPRMADLYRTHLKNWFAEGAGVYVVFSYVGKPSKWGSWGVLEYQDQPIDKAPKYRAVVEAAQGK